MRAANGIGATTSSTFHQRSPAAMNTEAPTSPVITAVPRFGSFRISATGARVAMAGGMRNSGLPIRSQVARWNQAASAITKAIFISSEGCNCKPPTSIQRCAPLPTWPIRSTSTSKPSATA